MNPFYEICPGGRAGIDIDASGFHCKVCGADLSKATVGSQHMRPIAFASLHHSKVEDYFARIEALDHLWFSMTPEEQAEVEGKLDLRKMKRPGT